MTESSVKKFSPNFSDKDIELLKHYFEFNKRYYDRINEELAPDLEKHPVWGPILRQMTPEQQEANRQQSLELQRAAIFEGKWDAYTENLITQGIMYARMNISYVEWYHLIKIARQQIFSHLLQDFPESENVISYMEGMTRLLDYAMYGIAEAYFTEKNNIIRTKDDLFKAIFENSVDHVMVIDKNMTIVMMNHTEQGQNVEYLIGKKLSDFPRQASYEDMIEAINKVLQNKKPYVYESEYLRGNEKLYYSSSLSPILDSNGEVEKIVFISRDISEKKRTEMLIREMNASLESKVNERTEELRKSNSELEQFAYVASHDLQEPLRTISNYVGLFNKKYKGKLDADSELYLNFMNTAAHRMQMQINDLLQYSRTGHDKTLVPIDCNELVQEVLDELGALSDEKMAHIKVDRLPVVKAYPDLKSLFQNLISNAIKFQKKEVPVQIHVSAMEDDKEWIFAVRDNGIGIEKQFQDRIFVIFQKLHDRSEYPGTGIGLAQSKKIAELHKGKIWLDSEPGKGSTFYFSISKNGAR